MYYEGDCERNFKTHPQHPIPSTIPSTKSRSISVTVEESASALFFTLTKKRTQNEPQPFKPYRSFRSDFYFDIGQESILTERESGYAIIYLNIFF